MTRSIRTPRLSRPSRRGFIAGAGAGLAGILAAARAPAYAQGAAPKKLVFAHINPEPESAAVAFAWMAKEVAKRSNGELAMEFYGSTLLTRELEIMNAVKSGNIAVGNPAGAAATIFPEMGVFLVPIVEPKDLRGMKLRVQLAKVFADTVNGLGANAVPMPWAEVIPAAQNGVIDGADLPIVNILALKAYEVSKYCSMTYHNYGPTVNVINLGVWNGLTAAQQKMLLDLSREAQQRIRQETESVDNLQKAKELLEPKGMVVNDANVEAFRKVAQDKIWPGYQKQFPELWEEIVKTEA